jgi:sigma-E factor negative regulatory protein RseA
MMTDNNLPLDEFKKALISDLADGLLRGSAFADAMSLLDSSSQARAYWHGLHVVGDVLRGEASSNASNTAKDMAFLDTFRANLTKESPLKVVAQVGVAKDVNDAKVRVAVSTANDSFFNWKWVGGLSAAAAVVAFSWNLVSNTAILPSGAAQAAPQAEPVVTQTSAGAMLRNPQLDALIAAHNQAGGSSALQMPSGFLRSATFTTDVPASGLGAK